MPKNYWLPWLADDQRRRIEKCTRDAKKLLEDRFWGAQLTRTLKCGKTCFLVSDYRGIGLVSGLIRYHFGSTNTKLLYRGQTKDYSLIPSLFRAKSPGPMISLKARKEAFAWLNCVLKEVESDFDPIGDCRMRSALALQQA
jgi:hypothetical protein